MSHQFSSPHHSISLKESEMLNFSEFLHLGAKLSSLDITLPIVQNSHRRQRLSASHSHHNYYEVWEFRWFDSALWFRDLGLKSTHMHLLLNPEEYWGWAGAGPLWEPWVFCKCTMTSAYRWRHREIRRWELWWKSVNAGTGAVKFLWTLEVLWWSAVWLPRKDLNEKKGHLGIRDSSRLWKDIKICGINFAQKSKLVEFWAGNSWCQAVY